MVDHKTVLLKEAVDALVQNPDGNFVDCTYGRGGHSAEIASRISAQGRLMVIDRDAVAIEHAKQQFSDDPRVVIVHGAFDQLARHVEANAMQPLSGVLMDLGVSSPQIDDAERGFSFMHDGPLDMRMDRDSGQSAAQWLATAKAAEIIDVLKTYGEERFARRIANRIVETRDEHPIERTQQLVEIIEAATPRKDPHKHPATRSFQAIRIHINGELDSLRQCLDDVVDLLVTGGRLVVISFHSLEDRMVKRFIRRMEQGEPLPSRLPIRDADIVRHLKSVGKAGKASAEEVELNARARSSVMRVAEKL